MMSMKCITYKHLMISRSLFHNFQIRPLSPCWISGKQYHAQVNQQSVSHKTDDFPINRSSPSEWRHPYLKMYPWRSLQDFVDVLHHNIIYEDDHMVAIDKPWGVGIHSAGLTVHKTNSHLLQREYFGNARYCVDDALPELEVKLRTNSLKVVKSIDRFESGLILLGKSRESEMKIRKACRTARSLAQPFMTYWCLCRGYPVSDKSTNEVERVAMKLIEVDELGDYKEPIIIKNFTKTQLASDDDMIVVRADCRVLQSNHNLSSSLLQISCDSIKWRFVQNYCAFKTSFVLGDVRFSNRVKEVLGNSISLVPQKMNTVGHSNYEPLHSRVRQKLRVARNGEIPLMVHRRKILLPNYKSKKESLTIESKILPPHFDWTAKKLGLLSFNPEVDE